MTFGKKLQEARKSAGLSQEQLAEKIAVSRSAVAKWESDHGLPDIDNLKMLSQLLGVSVDYLLDDSASMDFSVLKEPIDFTSFERTARCRDQYDAVVLAKFPRATSIVPLIREKVLSKTERLLEWTVMPAFGIFTIVDQINHFGAYYLAESDGKQYLTAVTKDCIVTSVLHVKITDKKFTIGNNRYTSVKYDLIGDANAHA